MNRKSIIILFVLSAVCVYLLYYHATRYTYSNQQATDYLTEHKALKSQSQCARYVRLAIEAGGCPTYSFPSNANGYFRFLPALGFTEIDNHKHQATSGEKYAR